MAVKVVEFVSFALLVVAAVRFLQSFSREDRDDVEWSRNALFLVANAVLFGAVTAGSLLRVNCFVVQLLVATVALVDARRRPRQSHPTD